MEHTTQTWQGGPDLTPQAARATVLRLAWPITCTMLGETLMGLVDTKLVSGLGHEALGGIGLANVLLYLTIISFSGLMRGVKVCTAHAVGVGRPQDGARLMGLGVSMALVLGLGATALLAHGPQLLALLHVDAASLVGAEDYLRARSMGLWAAFIVAALIEYRQGLGDVRLPMFVGLGGNVINGFLAYGLIYGKWGLPQLGMAGAGWGTAITEMVQLCVLGMAVLMQSKPPRHAPPMPFGALFVDLMRIGGPTSVHFFLEYLAFSACTAILAGLGSIEVSAHQITIVINRLAYLPGLALGEVACILVGQALGAGKLDAADQAVRIALNCALVFMVMCGLSFAVFHAQLAHFFTPDPQVATRAGQALIVAGMYQVLDAFNVVMRGALRGAKDVRQAAIIGVSVLWLCVPPLTWFFGRILGMGVVGGWLSFLIETGLCALLFSRRWWGGKWRITVLARSDLAALRP